MTRPTGLSHTFYNCSCGYGACQWCAGGLAMCTVCHAAEGELLSACPGHALDVETLASCYYGNVIDLEIHRNMRLAGLKLTKRGWQRR